MQNHLLRAALCVLVFASATPNAPALAASAVLSGVVKSSDPCAKNNADQYCAVEGATTGRVIKILSCPNGTWCCKHKLGTDECEKWCCK